jgi:hypothetical protein
VARSVGVCLSAITLLLTGCATRLPPPIETGAIERTTPDGPVRGLWARVRLTDPAVEIVTTAPLAAAASNPAGAEARLITVPKWAEAEHTTLAINANFFGVVVPPAPGEKDPGWFAGRPVDLRGLSVRDGVVVSPPRVTGGRGDPAVVFYADGHARVAPVTDKDLTGVTGAVAGLGPGDLLVTDGRNTGATSLVQPRVRHPRTAAGRVRGRPDVDSAGDRRAAAGAQHRGYSAGIGRPHDRAGGDCGGQPRWRRFLDLLLPSPRREAAGQPRQRRRVAARRQPPRGAL